MREITKDIRGFLTTVYERSGVYSVLIFDETNDVKIVLSYSFRGHKFTVILFAPNQDGVRNREKSVLIHFNNERETNSLQWKS